MPVRSIKLKLMTHSGDNAAMLRKALWQTHKLHNEGVAYYMKLLIMLRQRDVYKQDLKEPAESFRLDLLAHVRQQQQRNGSAHIVIPEMELTAALRELYELLVPSHNGGKGDSQQLSRAFLSPLTDPNSQGLEGTAKAGAKPRWQKMQAEGHPDWEAEKERAEREKEADPARKIMKQLREWGLKPLFSLFTNEQTHIQWAPAKKDRDFVRTWDRDMFQQALERLLSWEQWNHKVIEERALVIARREAYESEHFASEAQQAWLQRMRGYELERAAKLAEQSLGLTGPFRIKSRQLRGWKRVHDLWRKLDKKGQRSLDHCWEAVAKIQGAQPKDFGDPELYRFLAEPANHDLWLEEPERLFHLVTYNALLEKEELSKQQTTLTLPDAVEHPLWVRFDPKGGNLHSYELQSEDDKSPQKHLSVTFARLIWPDSTGDGTPLWIESGPIQVGLATSAQFYRQFRLLPMGDDNRLGKALEVQDYSAADTKTTGLLGGAKLQFERPYVEKHWQTVSEGDIGRAYFNVTIDMEPIQPMKNDRLISGLGKAFKTFKRDFMEVTQYKPADLEAWMATQPAKTELTGTKALQEGLRVISVDLGQRTAAAVSVFEVVRGKPDADKLFYPIRDTESLYAVHRRSHLLQLPGEAVTPEAVSERQSRNRAMYGIRMQVRLLSGILRLYGKEEAASRRKSITRTMDMIRSTDNLSMDDKTRWSSVYQRLADAAELDVPLWQSTVITAHRELEAIVSQAFSTWRTSSRHRGRGVGGKSMWSLEELDQTRKLLISWSKRAREPHAINRLDRNERFAQRLLTHLQRLKADRLKETANLIIMAALGYKYDSPEKGWLPVFPACQLILFEDLSRYRFKMDRSRSENSKLMNWAHRSIPREVYMQGQVFGLMVGHVPSEFTSRFHARTGAPGIRCHVVTQADLDGRTAMLKLVDQDFLAEVRDELQPGDLLPFRGGEIFVSLNGSTEKERALNRLHADINAAQNLQRRFWSRYPQDPIRISAQRITADQEIAYEPKTTKMKESMGKGFFQEFEISKSHHVYKWNSSGKLGGKKRIADSKDMEETDDLAEEAAAAEELMDGYVTLFRDPSGYYRASDLWVPQVDFWGMVTRRLESLLKAAINERPGRALSR